MYTATSSYKTAAKAYNGQRYVTITDGTTTITESDDLIRLQLEAVGGIGQVSIVKATIRHYNAYDFSGKTINIKAGISIDNTYTDLSKTANYTAVAGDDLSNIIFTGTGPFTLSLGAVAVLGDGYRLKITNNTDDILTIDPSGAEEIGGETTLEIPSGTMVYIKCDGTLWDYAYNDFGTVQYVDYGDFTVENSDYDEEVGEAKIEAYDALYQSMTESTIGSVAATDTVDDVLGYVCTELGITKASGSYPNMSTVVSNPDFFGLGGLKFRTILEYIAEVAGGLIRLNGSGELEVLSLQGTVDETLTLSEQNSLKTGTQWGGINSVVLSRTPQEDNIAELDQPDIDANGLFEIKFKNNAIADLDRETFITPIFTELDGFTMVPFDCETTGLGYLQVGDRITFEDLDETSHETTIFDIYMDFSGGLSERIKSDDPAKSSTNYDYAGIIGQEIKDTQIVVDKQAGDITLLTSEVNDVQSDVASLQVQVDEIEATVSTSGGVNLLKNSVGLKGTLEEWQDLDEEGNPVDARNEGTILTTNDVQENSESGSAINLIDQFIAQDIPTIAGEDYTFYSRFQTDGEAYLTIDGLSPQQITAGGYVDDTWAVFKIEFTATTSTTSITIDIDDGTNYINMTDMVVKLGDINGWIQAPNEVYGSNFRFDKDGFEVTSLTSTFKSVLDNDSLAVYDTAGGSDRIVMFVSKDSGRVTNFIAQDGLTIRQYEDDSKSLRFIPVSTGMMLVVNE